MPEHVDTNSGIMLNYHPELDHGDAPGYDMYAITTRRLERGDADALFVPDPETLRDIADAIEAHSGQRPEGARASEAIAEAEDATSV